MLIMGRAGHVKGPKEILIFQLGKLLICRLLKKRENTIPFCFIEPKSIQKSEGLECRIYIGV